MSLQLIERRSCHKIIKLTSFSENENAAFYLSHHATETGYN
jgi:tRNA isopentenyl-2-thiomethyl-A-37 hydroxylase MiaE